MKWILGTLLLLLAALVLESGLLAYATYVLLALLVLSRALAKTWSESLRAKRLLFAPGKRGDAEAESASETHVSLEAEIGDRVHVRLAIRNDGWLPVPWVLLEDLLPLATLKKDARLKVVKGSHVRIAMLRPGGELPLRYQLECLRRGCYQIGPLILENGDLFGLHRRYRVETEPAYLVVFPRMVALDAYEIASRRPIGDVRLTHRLYEDPTRIAGVRQYQLGDPLNRIHWKATARTGMLHSKVHEPSTLSGATVLLDFHQAGYGDRGEPFRSELAVTAALSLANAVCELGQQTGLATNARDGAERLRLQWKHEASDRTSAKAAAMSDADDRLAPLQIETRRGSEQVQQIRALFARVELTDGLTCAELLMELVGRLPRDATVLAVLPAVPEETALALGTLRRRGFAVAVVLVILADEALEQAVSRLYAEEIRDVRHIRDEAELARACRRQAAGR